MISKPKKQPVNDQDTADKGDYNTPIEESQRHTGVEEKDDPKHEALPESGSNAGPEGAPNQGTEKR